MLDKLFKRLEARRNAVAKAREGFISFQIVSGSPGWKIYEEAIKKKIDIIKNQMENKTDLTGEDLKKLQLALGVYRQVQLIPKKLKEDAMGGLR